MYTIQPNNRYRKLNYYDTLLLTSEEFKVEQSFNAMARHFHNDAFHGEGIAWGLQVAAAGSTITVDPGVALIKVLLTDEEHGGNAAGLDVNRTVTKEVVLTEQATLTQTVDFPVANFPAANYYLVGRPKMEFGYGEAYKGQDSIHMIEVMDFTLVTVPAQGAPPIDTLGQVILAEIVVGTTGSPGFSLPTSPAFPERVYCGLRAVQGELHRLKFLSAENDPNATDIATLEGSGTGLNINTAEMALTGNLKVTGDLVITGNTSTVNSVNLQVEDNVITLNRPKTGAGTNNDFPPIPNDYSGIEIHQAGTTWPALVWKATAPIGWKIYETDGVEQNLAYGVKWDRLSTQGSGDGLHVHSFLTKVRPDPGGLIDPVATPITEDLSVDTAGNVIINPGDLKVLTGALHCVDLFSTGTIDAANFTTSGSLTADSLTVGPGAITAATLNASGDITAANLSVGTGSLTSGYVNVGSMSISDGSFNLGTIGNITFTGGSVGIGVTTPAAELDVVGSVRIGIDGLGFGGEIRDTNNVPRIAFTSSSELKLFAYDGYSGPGTEFEALTIDAAGNIGINNMTPAPMYKLDIGGGVHIGESLPMAGDANLDAEGTVTANALFSNGTITAITSVSAPTFDAGATSIAENTINVGGAGAMTLTGNLIINGDITVSGTTTTVNSQELQVKDSIITVSTSGLASTHDGMMYSGLEVEMTGPGIMQFPALLFDKNNRSWSVFNGSGTEYALAYGDPWIALSTSGNADAYHGHNFLSRQRPNVGNTGITFIHDVVVDEATGLVNINSGATVSGTLTANNDATISGLLTASAGATVTGSLTANNAATVTGLLTANGGATVTGLLTANNAATVTGLLTANGGLNVTGDISITSGSVLQEGWTALTVATFNDTWANVGGVYNPAAYFKDTNGIVHIRGAVIRGTGGTSSPIIFNLPAGYQPAYQEVHWGVKDISGTSALVRVDIDTNGNVMVDATVSDGVSVSIDGLSFRAV